MASQPPPYGYGPSGQQVPPPPGAPAPGYGPPQPPGPPPGAPPAPPFGGGWGSAPTPPTPPKRNLSALWVVLGAVVIAALVAGAVVLIGGGSDDDAADTTERTRDTRTRRTTTTVAETTTTSPGTTTTAPAVTTTSLAPASTLPDTGAVDIGHGVSIPIPEGWSRTDEPGDPVVQVSDGTLKVDAQALQRTPGEEPADAMQEYIDLFDTDFEAVGYSPVTLRNTVSGPNGDLRNYGLYYRAVDGDYTGFDGAVYVLQRTDGLTVVLDYYSSRPSENGSLPDEDYDALIQSILDAPPLDDPVSVEDRATFRVNSVHPILAVDELIAFTAPPAWVDQSVDGAAVAFDGTGEWVIATKLTAQPDADTALAAAQADLAARYPGLTFENARTIEAWPGVERRDVDVNGPADPAIDPRARLGVTSVFYSTSTQAAYTFTTLWYGDVVADGSQPSPQGSAFAFDVFVDSLDSLA